MKKFAIILALTALAVEAKKKKHKDLPKPAPIPEPVPEPVVEPTPEEEAAEQTWIEYAEEESYYAKNLWLGAFQGLYGMSGKIDRPTEECFGEWIPETMDELKAFHVALVTEGIMGVAMEDAEAAAYDVVDLLFKNDEYCHFRKAFWDVHTYCYADEEAQPCAVGNALDNMQKNTFSIITQVSSAASIFKQQPWEEMDKESRGFALNQMGHSMAQLFADLVGFSASKVQHLQ